MNRMFFYVCMLLVIDMYGMELSKNVEKKHSINVKEFFPTIYKDVEKALAGVTITLSTDDKNYFLVQRKFLKNPNSTKSTISKERILFYQLINFKYTLRKDSATPYSESAGYILFNSISKVEIGNTWIEKILEFNGWSCRLLENNGENMMLHKIEPKSSFFNIGLAIEKATYKIHLMPNNETILNTVVALFQLLHENPKINNQYYLKDLIKNIKIKIDLEKNDPSKDVMPIIVIYVPNIFIDEQYKNTQDNTINNTFKQVFENALDNNTYAQFIDYKKAKNCTEILLAYLVYFFNQHKECQGSGIVPRFNAKVTDMIFFAQGNGDNKGASKDEYIKNLFENNWVYLKSTDDEDFKINIEEVLKNARSFHQEALNTQSTLTLIPKQKSINHKKNTQSSQAAPKPLQEEEPSLGIFAQISNWFKSWFYTLFQILNLGSM